MVKELEAGTVQVLTVDREVDFGYFLTNGEEDVLLHYSQVDGEIEVEDEVKVFLYHDKEVRLTATMNIPKVQIGSYAWTEVVDVNSGLGVFVDIGLQKDILVSSDDLPIYEDLWPAPGDKLYLSLRPDKNGRLYGKLATEDIIGQVARRATQDMMKAKVQGRVYRLLRVGTFFISEQGYRCFVHENERRQEPRLGELVEGRVIDVKEDGSLNVSFLPLKQDKMGEDADIITEYMDSRGGSMPLWDKSQPEEIKDKLGLSKASFKRAMGKLLKEGRVYQEEGWTYYKK